jgi:uncharacterized coiled-coil protein SlyX
MEDRIIQLEILIAMQDQTLAELNKEIYLQQQAIQKQEIRLRLLEQKLEETKEAPEMGGNEKPPHW